MKMVLCKDCIKKFRDNNTGVEILQPWEGVEETDICDECDDKIKELYFCEVEEEITMSLEKRNKIFKELCIDFRNDYFQVADLTLEEVIEKFMERFDTEFEETAALLTTNEEKVIKEHFGWTYNALIDLIDKDGYVMFVPTAPKQNIVEEFIWRDGGGRVMMDDYIDYDAVYDKLKADGKILETEDTIYALIGLVKTEEEFLEGDE